MRLNFHRMFAAVAALFGINEFGKRHGSAPSTSHTAPTSNNAAATVDRGYFGRAGERLASRVIRSTERRVRPNTRGRKAAASRKANCARIQREKHRGRLSRKRYAWKLSQGRFWSPMPRRYAAGW